MTQTPVRPQQPISGTGTESVPVARGTEARELDGLTPRFAQRTRVALDILRFGWAVGRFAMDAAWELMRQQLRSIRIQRRE